MTAVEGLHERMATVAFEICVPDNEMAYRNYVVHVYMCVKREITYFSFDSMLFQWLVLC